jgi:hypothetical protein
MENYASIQLCVGTEGTSHNGFYSYVCAEFSLLECIPDVYIEEIKITYNGEKNVFTYPNIGRVQGGFYRTPLIITGQGLETYPAFGWKVEATFEWEGKEYRISSIKQ